MSRVGTITEIQKGVCPNLEMRVFQNYRKIMGGITDPTVTYKHGTFWVCIATVLGIFNFCNLKDDEQQFWALQQQ